MPKEKGGKRNQGGKIEALVTELVSPIVSEQGFDLWDVRFEKEGAMWYLRILFDKEGGITSEECGEITEPLNKLIDKQSFIDMIDILEIGSPGLSRILRKPQHFEYSMGKPVKAMVRDENGKTMAVSGTLCAYNEEDGSILITELSENTEPAKADKSNKGGKIVKASDNSCKTDENKGSDSKTLTVSKCIKIMLNE